jgi:hypothetical protein
MFLVDTHMCDIVTSRESELKLKSMTSFFSKSNATYYVVLLCVQMGSPLGTDVPYKGRTFALWDCPIDPSHTQQPQQHFAGDDLMTFYQPM